MTMGSWSRTLGSSLSTETSSRDALAVVLQRGATQSQSPRRPRGTQPRQREDQEPVGDRPEEEHPSPGNQTCGGTDRIRQPEPATTVETDSGALARDKGAPEIGQPKDPVLDHEAHKLTREPTQPPRRQPRRQPAVLVGRRPRATSAADRRCPAGSLWSSCASPASEVGCGAAMASQLPAGPPLGCAVSGGRQRASMRALTRCGFDAPT